MHPVKIDYVCSDTILNIDITPKLWIVLRVISLYFNTLPQVEHFFVSQNLGFCVMVFLFLWAET